MNFSGSQEYFTKEILNDDSLVPANYTIVFKHTGLNNKFGPIFTGVQLQVDNVSLYVLP